MNNHEGPKTIRIPATEETVCNGCKYLNRQTGVRGRFVSNDNYYCLHPDAQFKTFPDKEGVLIHARHEGQCATPDWCPFLKPK